MVLAMVPANLLGHATRRNSLIDSVFHTSTIELFVECTYLFSDGFQELASSSESVASEQSVTEVNFLSMKITTKSRHRQWIGVSHFPKGRNDPENQVFGRRTLSWKIYTTLFLTPSKSRVWQKTLYTLIWYQDTIGRR